jgi:hypothetical protein
MSESRREHDPALRTLHLLRTDPLHFGWRDRIAAGWTSPILSGHDIGPVDFIPSHRVILTLRAINDDENDMDEMEAQTGRIAGHSRHFTDRIDRF